MGRPKEHGYNSVEEIRMEIADRKRIHVAAIRYLNKNGAVDGNGIIIRQNEVLRRALLDWADNILAGN